MLLLLRPVCRIRCCNAPRQAGRRSATPRLRYTLAITNANALKNLAKCGMRSMFSVVPGQSSGMYLPS